VLYGLPPVLRSPNPLPASPQAGQLKSGGTTLRANSIFYPMRMVTFHPVQNARPKQPQRWHVIGKQSETKWKHPESNQGKKPEDTSNCQQ
jgi:hypothetical protein